MNKEELKQKVTFARSIGKAVATGIPRITSIDYVVFQSEVNPEWYTEFVVVHYAGDAVQARDCTGNSCSAIFTEIGTMLNTSQRYPENTEMYLSMLKTKKQMEL